MNDSPVDCQSRGMALPQQRSPSASRRIVVMRRSFSLSFNSCFREYRYLKTIINRFKVLTAKIRGMGCVAFCSFYFLRGRRDLKGSGSE